VVLWLVGLLIVSAIGFAAVLFWPRSAPQPEPVAAKAEKPTEIPEILAPLGDLDELSDDVAAASDENKAEPQWTNASAEPIRRGDVSVRILSAEIGRPRLVRATGRAARPTDEFLILRVQLQNENTTRKLEYRGWAAGQSSGSVKLTDNFNNPYFQKSWQSATIDGQLTAESLYPGKPVEDVLVFQKPLQKAETLRLLLPAAAFGEKGMLGFEIPMAMVSLREEPDGSAPVAAASARDASEPLPPGRGVPAIDRGIADLDQSDQKPQLPGSSQVETPMGGTQPGNGKKPATNDPQSIVDMVNQDTEAIGGGDKETTQEHDFEDILRDRKDLEPGRRDEGRSDKRPPQRRAR
jgi:hypothetical protein